MHTCSILPALGLVLPGHPVLKDLGHLNQLSLWLSLYFPTCSVPCIISLILGLVLPTRMPLFGVGSELLPPSAAISWPKEALHWT